MKEDSADALSKARDVRARSDTAADEALLHDWMNKKKLKHSLREKVDTPEKVMTETEDDETRAPSNLDTVVSLKSSTTTDSDSESEDYASVASPIQSPRGSEAASSSMATPRSRSTSVSFSEADGF